MIKSTGAPLLFTALSAGQTMASGVASKGDLPDRSCHVPGDSLSKHVVFKTRASGDFWYPSGRSSTESFVIRLESCHATAVDRIVTLTFKGTEETALPGRLKVTGVNAGWLGTTPLNADGSSLLKPGASHNRGRGEKVIGSNLELPFGVYVVATLEALRAKGVVPGDHEAIATFELTYR